MVARIIRCMFAEDPRIDRGAIASTLRSVWDIEATSLVYVPVGFGTHHYLARAGDGKWFINVDDLAAKTWLAETTDDRLDGLRRQMRTARALRDAGLEFIHAPLAGTGGEVLVHVGDFAVSVFDHLEGRSADDGAYTVDDERRQVLDAVRRIHGTTDAIDATIPPVETFVVPARVRFLELLDDLGSEWNGGPYAQGVRDVLRRRKTAVLERLAAYDDLVRRVEASSPELVITHGEPHAANVMWTPDGMRLIDWDTVALAPRERDYWMLRPPGGPLPVDQADGTIIELFETRWDLWEITGYSITLHDAHVDDANTRVAWKELNEYLGER